MNKSTLHPYLSITSIGSISCIDRTIAAAVIPEYMKGIKVNYIGAYAFSWCKSLSFIIIPASVTAICSFAFAGCSALTEITIPDSITDIGFGVFYECSSLESIYIDKERDSLDLSKTHIPENTKVYWKGEF